MRVGCLSLREDYMQRQVLLQERCLQRRGVSWGTGNGGEGSAREGFYIIIMHAKTGEDDCGAMGWCFPCRTRRESGAAYCPTGRILTVHCNQDNQITHHSPRTKVILLRYTIILRRIIRLNLIISTMGKMQTPSDARGMIS